MSFNTTSYFAGVATVFAAITLGFAGGFLISNPTPKGEPPNRVERVAAAPLPNPAAVQVAAAVPKPDIAASSPAASAPEAAAVPQPVAQPQPEQQGAATLIPVMAKDDTAESAKIQEAERRAIKRARHRRWAERQHHRQELDVATGQVRQVDRGEAEQIVQHEPLDRPRFGLFGNND